MRRQCNAKTGLPWCRVHEVEEIKKWLVCDSCNCVLEGPHLEVPADGNTSGVACLSCVREALDEYEGTVA